MGNTVWLLLTRDPSEREGNNVYRIHLPDEWMLTEDRFRVAFVYGEENDAHEDYSFIEQLTMEPLYLVSRGHDDFRGTERRASTFTLSETSLAADVFLRRHERFV